MKVYEYNYPATINSDNGCFGIIKIGQSFTIGTTGTNEDFSLTSIVIKAKRILLPGTCIVEVTAVDSNGFPTGGILSTGSFDGNAIHTAWRDITISMSATVLRRDTKYAYYVTAPDASGGNQLRIGANISNLYAGGRGIVYGNIGHTYWENIGNNDMYFAINGSTYTGEIEETPSTPPSFPFQTYISGYLPRYQKRQIVGYHSASGDLRPVEICASGQLMICSGVHVVADVEVEVSSGQHVVISGQPVTISGDHVFVESGTHVNISGQHVHLESGDTIDIHEYGYYVLSGDWRPKAVCLSGEIVVCSGLHVVADVEVEVSSGQHVVISGQPVTISGGHVFVESGAHVVVESGIGVIATVVTDVSGQPIHVGCADTIRTGKLVQLLGGTSGWPGSGSYHGSGGMSLCISGQWCSGPVHTLIVKNVAGNDAVYIGEVNCKPYSGYGFLLAASEAINLDYCSVCDVYVFAQTSGQYVTWIGTDY